MLNNHGQSLNIIVLNYRITKVLHSCHEWANIHNSIETWKPGF